MIGLEPITCWLQISCSANWATSAYYTAQLICNQPALPTIASLHSTIVMNWATSAYTISAHIIVQMIFIRNQSVPFNTYYIVSLTTRQLKYNTSDSDGNRTRVTAVKGRCLNRLTMEPQYLFSYEKTPRVGLEPTTTRLTAECSTIELSRIICIFFVSAHVYDFMPGACTHK